MAILASVAGLAVLAAVVLVTIVWRSVTRDARVRAVAAVVSTLLALVTGLAGCLVLLVLVAQIDADVYAYANFHAAVAVLALVALLLGLLRGERLRRRVVSSGGVARRLEWLVVVFLRDSWRRGVVFWENGLRRGLGARRRRGRR